MLDTLRIGDYFNYEIVYKHIWGCSVSVLKEHFKPLVSDTHLDLSVKSGYLLSHLLGTKTSKVVIADRCSKNLARSSVYLARFQPETLHLDPRTTFNTLRGSYDSVSINFLLQELPGPIEHKGRLVFNDVYNILESGGVVFGSTLVSRGITKPYLTKKLMRHMNRNLTLRNNLDSPSAIKRSLTKYFTDIRVEVIGCVALFSARKP